MYSEVTKPIILEYEEKFSALGNIRQNLAIIIAFYKNINFTKYQLHKNLFYKDICK